MEIKLSNKDYQKYNKSKTTDFTQLVEHAYNLNFIIEKLLIMPINIGTNRSPQSYYVAPILLLRKSNSRDIGSLVQPAVIELSTDKFNYGLIFPTREQNDHYIFIPDVNLE
ncbi:hypothetical protein HYU21_00260 [Candidatus Woesearchaeota archaeon]|nr:hypothetical protein [Candidatus Woesearchaeota archaeon]